MWFAGRLSLVGVVAWFLQNMHVPRSFVDGVHTVQELNAPRVREQMPSMDNVELVNRLAQAHIPRGSHVRADTGEMADTRAWPRRPIDVTRWRWT